MLFSFSLCLRYDFKWLSFVVEFSFHFIGTFNFEWARLYTIQCVCWDIYIFVFVGKCIEIRRFHIYFMHIFGVQLNATFSIHVITTHRWINFWCYDKSIFRFLLLRLLSWFLLHSDRQPHNYYECGFILIFCCCCCCFLGRLKISHWRHRQHVARYVYNMWISTLFLNINIVLAIVSQYLPWVYVLFFIIWNSKKKRKKKLNSVFLHTWKFVAKML